MGRKVAPCDKQRNRLHDGTEEESGANSPVIGGEMADLGEYASADYRYDHDTETAQRLKRAHQGALLAWIGRFGDDRL